MILIGGLSTFLGLIINARLRKNVDPVDYDERFSNDKFGLLVTFKNEDYDEVENILKDFGSEELKVNGETIKDTSQEILEENPLEADGEKESIS
jgi:hypothetical protein